MRTFGKKMPIFKYIVVIVCLFILPAVTFAELPTPTYGWNLGNTMEPPCGEGCWAPAATQQLINAVADAGFNTIRIPVAWNSHANQTTYVIDSAWLMRVKQVVDWCYARNLHVIINSHWDNGWLDSVLDGNVDESVNARMNSYWTQIANTFINYDDKLLFAGANEPPADTAAKMSELMTYYQTFVNAVRATGGQNTNRWLVLSAPSTNIDLADSLMNTLPSDPTPGRLMVEVHDYTPYQYTLMKSDADWGKMFYFWGQGYHHPTWTERNPTWGEEDYIQGQYQKMKTKFVDHGVPVLLGEFGTGLRSGYSGLTGADYDLHVASRTYWNKTIIDYANAHGLRPVYWDNGYAGSNGFALFDRVTAAVVDQVSITSLTGGAALPPPSGGDEDTGVLYERWTGISGTSVSNLTSNANYPDNPSFAGRLSSLEGPTNITDNYGSRIRGYLYPPTTGSYTFWIAGDDNCELWLSSDGTTANASLIANVPEWTNSREWTKYPSQQSAAKSLTARQKYYIEVLHKENTGGDNIAAAWQGPGISQQVIAGEYLSPWINGLYGDFDGSSTVLINDLMEFAAVWIENDCVQTSRMDLDGDCVVDFYEFSRFAQNWLE